MESRPINKTPVECEDCGWRGAVSECIHTYLIPQYLGTDEPNWDIKLVDECPKCNSRNLIEPKGKGVLVGVS